MFDRWLEELRLVEASYGTIEAGPELAWFIIPRWTLIVGWNKDQTPLLVQRPPGYPVTPPDNFYVDPELRLAGGAKPGNADLESQAARSWLRFSYHVEQSDWSPHAEIGKGHNLLTFLHGVKRRLEELS